MRTRIKICGITQEADAQAAIRAGADAIGFVFWPGSPRAITVSDAAAIARSAPFVARVGVFVNAPPGEVAAVVRDAALDAVQLHGDERTEDYRACGAPVIKAVPVCSDADVSRAAGLGPEITVMADAVDPKRRGGTGRVADWRLVAKLATQRPVILAGGLTPENVGRAIAEVRPWGVDVSSGVELAPGRKDHDAIAAFCAAVVEANREAM